MMRKLLLAFSLLIPIICVSSGAPITYMSEFNISVDPTAHNTYGLSYPVTYVFELPNTTQSAKVFYRFSENETWTQLPEKTSSDFFNGINAVRFNYSAHRAYVSIAFASYSDNIYLKFTDGLGNPINVTFIEIAKYYDNRKAVVTATADDWIGLPDFDADFKTACKAFRDRKMWLTVGIVPRYNTSYTNYQEVLVNWSSIQEELDAGFIEPASHSMTHQLTPYDDYDFEIGLSKQYIIDNLTLPEFNRKGSQEYVYVWIEPYGSSDATVRAKLGQYKYLIDRDTTTNLIQSFTSWDAANGLYGKTGRSVKMEGTTGGVTDVATLNSYFDTVYNNGGIYHLMFHPDKVDWTPGSYVYSHLDYISGRKDVWYVGFGHLYLYHFVQERGVVTVTSLPSSDTLYIYNILFDTTEISKPVNVKVDWFSTKYNLSNLTFKFDFDGDGVWDKITYGDDVVSFDFKKPDTYTITVEIVSPDGEKVMLKRTVRIVSFTPIIGAANTVDSTGKIIWSDKGGELSHVVLNPVKITKQNFGVFVNEENINANTTGAVILNITFTGLAGGDVIWLNETVANAISVDLLHNGEPYLTGIPVKNGSVNLTLTTFSTYTIVVNNTIPSGIQQPTQGALTTTLILVIAFSLIVFITYIIRKRGVLSMVAVEQSFKFFKRVK